MWLIFIECDPYSNSDIQSFKGSQLISIVTFKEHKILFSLIIFIYNYVIQKCRYLYEIPNNIKKVCLHINGKHKKTCTRKNTKHVHVYTKFTEGVCVFVKQLLK